METTATHPERRALDPKRLLVRVGRARPEFGVIAIAVLLVIVFSATSGGIWISAYNLTSVLQVTATLGIMALGVSLVIGTGHIDISVGSVFGIGALVYLGSISTIGVVPAALLAVVVAALIGVMNGYLVAKLDIPSLIVTLGSLFIFRGLAIALTEGFSFSVPYGDRGDLAFQVFGGTTVVGLSTAVFWALLVLIVLHVAIFWTVAGNRLLAVGGDAESAHSRGVRVDRVTWLAFIACSALAGFGGVLEAGKLGFADGSFGRLMELQAIASCVLGGCLLTGGRVSVIGTLVGAFLLSSIQSYLVIMGVQPQWFILLLGAIVVGAALADRKFHAWLGRQ
jgi:ribose transport system permease protein